MYFHESDIIAIKHQDLQPVIEQVDEMLATIFTAAPLRSEDFSYKLACDANQVISIFDLLVEHDVLFSESMVECEWCHNLMPLAALDQAIKDEDEFECTSCSRTFRRDAPVTRVYRMSVETLARPRPAVATADVESALRYLDQHPNVFQRIAQTWVLKYEGKMVLMQNAGGMHYLARLLAEPERTIPAAFLLAAEAGGDPRALTGISHQLVDKQAMAEYKQRYSDAEEELEEAKKRSDQSRIPKLQSEIEKLGAEIVRLSGLGGKIRSKSDADRARRSVSAAVKRAIDSIRNEHNRLGQHLRNSVSSGFIFCYAPERDPDWLI